MPSAMFVVVSWISFLMPLNGGERAGLLVTLFLVLVSMFLTVVTTAPKGKFISKSTQYFESLPIRKQYFNIQIDFYALTYGEKRSLFWHFFYIVINLEVLSVLPRKNSFGRPISSSINTKQGGSENSGEGARSSMVGIICPPVEIRLTDLLKSGGQP